MGEKVIRFETLGEPLVGFILGPYLGHTPKCKLSS